MEKTQNTQNTNLKPSVGSVLTHAWTFMWEHFITLFLITLVVWVAYMPLSIMDGVEDEGFASSILGIFSLLYLISVVGPINMSTDFLFLKGIRGKSFEVKEIFDVFKNYLNVVLAVLLKLAIIGIGLAFLIIPGIIFACRLVLVPYLVLDKKLDAVKAVEESWRLTRGHGWKILWLGIVSFFLAIGGLMVLVFGVVIAAIWTKAAFAAMYQAILIEKGEYVDEDMPEDAIALVAPESQS